MRVGPVPRALLNGTGLRSVQASGESEKPVTLDTVLSAFEAFKTKYDKRQDDIEAAIDANAVKAIGRRLNGDGGEIYPAADAEYTGLFSAYFRGGRSEGELKDAQALGNRAAIHASMSVGTNSDGGYLAPTEWDRQINQKLASLSPIRRLADVKLTGVNGYSTLWKVDGPGSGWVGETAARPATATPTFQSLIFGHGEIYANPAITQRLLDDALTNIGQWLTDEVDTEFAKQEGIAFLSGDGVNKPFGLLTYIVGGAAATQHPGGTLGISVSGQAAAIGNVDSLIDFTYALGAPYRQNAAWLMNSLTAAALAKMKNSDGDLIWRESLMLGQPASLLGRPVEIDEGMPNIGAGAYPIAFGDFKAGYVINDRIGTRILRDPFTNKPFVHFYCTKRVGGGVKDPNAIRLYKIAAS